MIEGLAKTIGYEKIRAVTASRDTSGIIAFMKGTGLNTKVFSNADETIKNNITSVPVTIIEDAAGKNYRFDGFTGDFFSTSGAVEGINANITSGQNLESKQGVQQCTAK